MDLGVAGRVAFICGGSKGLGRATAEILAQDGCKVAIVARGREALDATVQAIRAKGGEAVGIAADITDVDQLVGSIREARERLGPIEIAVYNGLTPKHGTFDGVTAEDFARTYHEIVTCFAAMVREVVDDMKAHGWGRIVTIGSRTVKQPARTHEVPYVLANTHRIAAVGLSKTLANELGPYGITVNTVGTGRFDTEANVTSSAEVGTGLGISREEYLAERVKFIPLRRLGRPEEMGALVSFLCSIGGGYITGETICCDGGRNESML